MKCLIYGFMPAGLDGGDNGRLASRLAGWLVGARHVTTTVMEVESAAKPHR